MSIFQSLDRTPFCLCSQSCLRASLRLAALRWRMVILWMACSYVFASRRLSGGFTRPVEQKGCAWLNTWSPFVEDLIMRAMVRSSVLVNIHPPFSRVHRRSSEFSALYVFRHVCRRILRLNIFQTRPWTNCHFVVVYMDARTVACSGKCIKRRNGIQGFAGGRLG